MGRFKSNRRMILGVRAAQDASSMGQGAVVFVGAYDALTALLDHVYEPGRCTLSAYTGNALLRLRRGSDNVESDFSHVSASDPELDIASITAWLAGAAGYVVRVYDQRGGDNISWAVADAQPLFVASAKNGHAGLQWDGFNDVLQGAFINGGAIAQPFNVLVAGKLLSAAEVNDDVHYNLVGGDDVTNNIMISKEDFFTPDGWGFYAGTGPGTAGAADANWHLFDGLFNGVSSAGYIDSVLAVSGNMGTKGLDGITWGATYTPDRHWKGLSANLIVCAPSLSAENRALLEAAVNAYWAIY